MDKTFRTCVFVALLALSVPMALGQIAHPTDLADGIPGVTIEGTSFDFGNSVSCAGDVNRDGFMDFLISAPGDAPCDGFAGPHGQFYLVYGDANGLGFDEAFDPTTLDGTNGLVIRGAQCGILNSQSTVAGVGDVDGDGFDDVLVWRSSSAGEVTLVRGAALAAASGPLFDLAELEPTQGTLIREKNEDEGFSGALSGAGDVNGDGYHDFLVGATLADPDGEEGAGETYLIYGSDEPLGTNGILNVADLDGMNGVAIKGKGSDHRSGDTVDAAGDLNGDGFDDFLISAPRVRDESDTLFSEVYVIYGSPTGIGSAGVLRLSSLDGVNGATIIGKADNLLVSESGAGDVDGDGFDDFLLGSGSDYYVVYGSADGIGSGGVLDLASPGGARVSTILSPQEQLSRGAGVGDVNGDGFADCLLGARFADPLGRDEAGVLYLLYGVAGGIGTGGSIDVNDLNGVNGSLIQGPQARNRLGRSVAGAGDMNGDGFADLLASAPDRNDNPVTHLLYGDGPDPDPSGARYRSRMRSGVSDVPGGFDKEIPLEGVGRIGDGSHSLSFSRCALAFTGGGTGPGLTAPSVQTVTLFREAVPEPAGVESREASVHWRIETDRVEFSESTIVLSYLESEMAGLDLDEAGVYYTPDESLSSTTAWRPLIASHDPEQRTFTIHRSHDKSSAREELSGFYTILELQLENVVGSEIQPPPGVLAEDLPSSGPEVEPSDAVFWHIGEKKLYAVREGPATVTWKDTAGDILAVVDVTLVWSPDPSAYRVFVAQSQPAQLDPEDTFGNIELVHTESGTGSSVAEEGFSSPGSGRSLIRFSTGENPAQDPIFFKNVLSIPWDDPDHLRDEVPATIGEEITDTLGLHDATCGGPLVLFGRSRVAADPGYYDPATRTGPIIPVNRNGPAEEEQLVVVYYQKDMDGICWPANPVRYVPDWPADTEKIVIASTQGSGPLGLEGMEIYRQPDPNQLGFNLNEEHALILPRQGTPPRLSLSAQRIMVLEGGSADVRVSLASDEEPPADVLVNLTSGRNADASLAQPSPAELAFRVDVEPDDPEHWQNPRVLTFPAASDEDADNGATEFTLRATGGLFDTRKLTVVEADTDIIGLLIDRLEFRVAETESDTLAVRLTRRPSTTVTVSASRLSGDEDLAITEGETLTFAPSEFDVPQFVRFEARADADESDSHARFLLEASGGSTTAQIVDVHEADANPASQAVFALRDDLNRPETSEPFVLVKFVENEDRHRIRVFEVVAEQPPAVTFNYSGVAGQLLQPPYPLTVLPSCLDGGSQGVSGNFFQDRNGSLWARAAGFDADGNPAPHDIVVRYFYPALAPFDFPPDVTPPAVGDCIPWLDQRAGTPGDPADPRDGEPIDVTFTVTWPEEVPELRVGETLMTPKFGLPNVTDQCSAAIVYQEAVAKGQGESVMLIDPLAKREVDLIELPPEISTENRSGKQVLVELPAALRRRVRFDPAALKLELEGVLDSSGTGEPLLLLNVLTMEERDRLLSLSTDVAYQDAVQSLYLTAQEQLSGTTSLGAGPKALTAGFAEAEGFVTLTFQNDPDCDPLPVSLEVIRVNCPLYRGEVKVVTPDCPFEEKLSLRHTGDFAGQADDFEFEWMFRSDEDGTQPPTPDVDPNWTPHLTGRGLNGVTIEGPGLLTLSDNWFTMRYRYVGPGSDDDVGRNAIACTGFSDWTPPQLATGWIKRVLDGVTPFEQLTSNFHDTEIDTVVSMISQAGTRFTGDIALNCSPSNDFGLIEAYETVLNRGKDLSVNAGFDFEPANVALLQAAGRVADLYMMLGNEAYGDAKDPTIGFGTQHGQFGSAATTLHCFMNQTSSLLEEELELLHGRDDTRAPGVEVFPVYNRLFWNLTGDITGGEVAYTLNYNITDQDGDGEITEEDARIMYPQGHGDAWGHYLSAIKAYYGLLSHPNYTWIPRAEAVLVAGAPVTVDFLDERKFATAAAARARCGAEIVNLLYRQAYTEDPEGQYEGYKDSDPERAWGLSGWSWRAGQGAYLDWVVGNAVLPPEDEAHTGIQKVDRTTVRELREIPSRFLEVQAEMDKADQGLNPLGLAKNVVPFDISPTEIDAGKTHFEQIFERAMHTVENAETVFDHANRQSQLLRRQQDSIADFQRTVEEREADFRNRLIEVFGYPYREDIGATGTYPQGYDGPDLYHFDYVDVSELTGFTAGPVQEYVVEVHDSQGNVQDVVFHLSTKGFGHVKPPHFTQRRAPGEVQLARSDLLQELGRFRNLLADYNNLLAQIDDERALLEARYDLNAERIKILDEALSRQWSLFLNVRQARAAQMAFRQLSKASLRFAKATAEGFPKIAGVIAGMSNGVILDATAPARSGAVFAAAVSARFLDGAADVAELTELSFQQKLRRLNSLTNLRLVTERQEFEVLQAVKRFEQLVRKEASQRLALFTQSEVLQQTAGRYNAVLARGYRILEDRLRFRKQTAAQTQAFRYRDMAFRIFRNDALAKYRSQFDMAARYVYLAGRAYDYETNLLESDRRGPGQQILTDIIRQRSIGQIDAEGRPQPGRGLADAMARMSRNWDVLEPQLGFNNPQTETTRFSLRTELFRIDPGPRGDSLWRETLERHVVDNVLDFPEFRRYCRPFQPSLPVEPGIVIPFETHINFGLNFFGWELGGGDSAYDSSHFATKVRSVGVWFTDYNQLGGGMSSTPRIYLIPVGSDVLRSPTDSSGAIRQWKVVEQKLPLPFPLTSSEIENNLEWIPRNDSLSDEFADIQRHSSFRAFHDSGDFRVEETIQNSRLIGRSVWNTRWVLIIPAGTLHFDREEGIERFIHGDTAEGGVQDIKIFFQTYAYSGN